ncbi:MAG: M28 family peptidase [Vulcanisaeta sp.]
MDELETALNIARRCSSYIDLMGGTMAEYEFLQWFLNQIDNPLLSYELQPISVLIWRDRFSRIVHGNTEFKALSMPLTLGGSGRGKLTANLNDVEGKILLTDFPEDMDDAKYVYIKAMERGALAVIFRDRFPGVVRRIVVTATPDYTWDRAPPPTMPAFTVSREVGDELSKYVGEEVEFVSDVETRLGTGYNLIVNLEGDKEERVLLAVHHDHWLTGFADNCLGIGLGASLLLNNIRSRSEIKRGLSLISFTAEEAGNPGFASLYWAYGSTRYVEFLERRGLLDSIYSVINLDVIGRQYVVHTSEDLSMQLSQFVSAQWDLPKPYFDSLNFEMNGIPSMTISSLDYYWDVYHTDKDVEDRANSQDIDSAFKVSKQLLTQLLTGDLRPTPFISVLNRDLVSVGLGIELREDWATYRFVKYLLSKYVVEFRRDGSVKVVYTNSILSYVRRFININDINQVPLRVEEFGTGKVIMDTTTIKNTRQLSEYVSQVIESLTEDMNINLVS